MRGIFATIQVTDIQITFTACMLEKTTVNLFLVHFVKFVETQFLWYMQMSFIWH